MKIAIGSDKYGYQLKEFVKAFLRERNIEVEDYGVNHTEAETPYYEVADQVARRVSHAEFQRGILVCGTGMGMSIIANKHPGVYAAVCENVTAAARSRSINDSNILTLGGFVTEPAEAKEIVDVWLKTEFTQGWEKPIADWLKNSRSNIRKLENRRFGKEDE